MESGNNKSEPIELTMEREKEQEEAVVAVKKSSRRPDIDLIRIVLTWGILLYHTVLIYTPWAPYYVKIFPQYIEGWHYLTLWFIISMNVWNMPMFFFLSGIRKDHNFDAKKKNFLSYQPPFSSDFYFEDQSVMIESQCILWSEEKELQSVPRGESPPPPGAGPLPQPQLLLFPCYRLLQQTLTQL